MTATTRPEFRSVSEPTLYVAFELSAKDWKLAMTSGFGVEPWVRTVAAGDLRAVERALGDGRRRYQLPAAAAMVSCYEAGRDGFWIHRALATVGVTNRVVDSASIEVNRRARRAKTDRLDALKLVRMLVRVCSGERDVWREVRVPPPAEEAARHVSRDRTALLQDHTRLINQMRSWLATCGCRLPGARPTGWWTTVHDWAGALLPGSLHARLARAHARCQLLETQIAELDAQQEAAVTAAPADSALRRLTQLKGVAATSASILIDEGLVWRAFQNRRQVGGLLGYAPLPFDSGAQHRDQGISHAGNARLQAVSIQLAWNWLRWQPLSSLTSWYRERFARGGKRVRRIGIVAVARRLLIALWRYATSGVVPANAIVKAA
jgi:transposase